MDKEAVFMDTNWHMVSQSPSTDSPGASSVLHKAILEDKMAPHCPGAGEWRGPSDLGALSGSYEQ